MNILHVSAQRPDSTGSGVYLSETVQALGEMGHAQAVVAGVGPRDVSPFASDVLFVPVRFETPELPFPVVGMSDVMPYRATRYRDLTPEMVGRFKAAFSEAFDDVFAAFAPDIVLCHHLYLACGVLMQWLDAHPAVRTACSVRGISHNTDIRQFCAHGLQRDFILRGVRTLDRACALHEAQAREIVETFGIDESRVRVTGTGFNDRVFSPWSATSAKGNQAVGEPVAPDCGGGSRLVYVGKLWKQKGLIELMGALDLLPSGIACTVRLDMVGGYSDEAEYGEIRSRAALCQVPVCFHGQVGQERLVELYRKADVFVLPSFSEGLPLVMIEALACGCKVVATDLLGVRAWLARYAPDAPIRYVSPPAMSKDSGPIRPDPIDAGRFERDLAAAIVQSLDDPANGCDLSALSWSALAERLIAP